MHLKIVDTSTLIGIISELDRPDLIDSIIKLGHTLAIAGHVNNELRKSDVREVVEGMVRQGKIRVFAASAAADMEGLKSEFPTLGLGESATLLLYGRVHLRSRSYCILDDRQARQAAKNRSVPFTGLLGLLTLLKERGIVGGSEASGIVKDLKRAGFWMPANFAI